MSLDFEIRNCCWDVNMTCVNIVLCVGFSTIVPYLLIILLFYLVDVCDVFDSVWCLLVIKRRRLLDRESGLVLLRLVMYWMKHMGYVPCQTSSQILSYLITIDNNNNYNSDNWNSCCHVFAVRTWNLRGSLRLSLRFH